VLNATISEEACPNNLAPTTSTTAHLAMGDALAVCLLELRNFSKDDFAKLHPGGALGKQLYLQVGDLLSQHQVPSVSADASLKEVIIEISSKRLGATAVVNGDQQLVGIVTDGDLRRMLETGKPLADVKASDIMTKNPRTIESNDYAAMALQVMQENSITQLVVVRDGAVAGFVHLHDLLREGIV